MSLQFLTNFQTTNYLFLWFPSTWEPKSIYDIRSSSGHPQKQQFLWYTNTHVHTYMHSRDSLSSLCFEVLLRMLMLVIYWRRFCSLRNSLLCTWDCGTRARGGLPWLRSVNVAFSFSVINLPLFVHAGESAAGFVLLHTKGAITCQHPKCPHHQIHLQAHLIFFSILSVSWASRLVCSFFRNLDFYLLQLKCFRYLTQTYMKCSL